ncbi:MAG: 6,7-dimethyl-8-ribityllumazine synthase [Bdellovibrionales bacterium]|nr:6,7-dimethyl-8-ribityllumazine synthase [Bdellovibrionales bacterium]
MKKTSFKKIGLALSSFNLDIAIRLKEGALDELKKTGINNFEIREVPGVVEIPLLAQWLFQKNCQAVIALGAVIRGETAHFDACCRMVEQGCMQVQLKMNRPIIFGILMTENKAQALARSGGKKGHIGRLAVQTTLKMLSFMEEVQRN